MRHAYGAVYKCRSDEDAGITENNKGIKMSITAMKQAVEALEKATPVKAKDPQMQADAITALRTAIAEAEKQEPCGHVDDDMEFHDAVGYCVMPGTKLYLAPQPAPKQEPEDKCWCDATGIGEPGVSCGDCPTRDYAAPAQEQPVNGFAGLRSLFMDSTGQVRKEKVIRYTDVLHLLKTDRAFRAVQAQTINQPPILDSHNQSNEPVS